MKSEILKQIRQIEIKADRLAKNSLIGAYSSFFHGRGVEFEDIREYSYGDDVRSIDWRSSAKGERVYIKKYREEKNVDLFFLIDLSSSMQDKMKIQTIGTIFLSIALAAIKKNDRIGAVLFSDKIEKLFPLKNSKTQLFSILDAMLAFDERSKTNINETLVFVNKYLKKRTALFLLSDMIDDKFEDELEKMKKRHEVYIFQVMNYDFIPEGYMLRAEDSETGEQAYVRSIAVESKYPKIFTNRDLAEQISEIVRRK